MPGITKPEAILSHRSIEESMDNGEKTTIKPGTDVINSREQENTNLTSLANSSPQDKDSFCDEEQSVGANNAIGEGFMSRSDESFLRSQRRLGSLDTVFSPNRLPDGPLEPLNVRSSTREGLRRRFNIRQNRNNSQGHMWPKRFFSIADARTGHPHQDRPSEENDGYLPRMNSMRRGTVSHTLFYRESTFDNLGQEGSNPKTSPSVRETLPSRKKSGSVQETTALISQIQKWRKSIARGSIGTKKASQLPIIVDKQKLREKIQRAWTTLLRLLGMYKRARTSIWWGKAYAKQKECVDYLPTDDESDQRFLIFDPSDYKANKQMRMTTDARRILQKPADRRSEQDVYYARLALRGIKLIADYPDRMQHNLAKYGRFESYEPGRALVKEGHPPNAFYFILFGSVIVSVMNLQTGVAETKCFLHRGESFGELAIRNRSARQSTVITKTYLELLSIDVDTYEKIFMVGGKKNINDPDQTEFLETLTFLNGWPTNLLWENPDEMVFSYFTRDTVLVKDTRYSKWIVIVKSGSVRVLKKLAVRKPTVNARTGKMLPTGPSKFEVQMAFENGGLHELLTRLKSRNVPGMPMAEPVDEDSRADDEVGSDGSWSYSVNSLRRAQSAVDRFSERPSSGVLFTGSEDSLTRVSGSVSARGTGSNKMKSALVRKSTLPARGRKESTRNEHRTFVDDLNDGYEHVITEADRNPVFVHIRTLLKGGAYGVAPLLFPDQPGFCLVSNGADCVLLNRDFYLENCPPQLLRKLRHKLSPYPSEEKLQTDLQTLVNWDTYKRATVNLVQKRPLTTT